MPRPIEGRGLSTTGAGTSLTTTLALVPIAVAGKVIGRGHLTLMPRNAGGGALTVRFALSPRLSVLVSKDSFAALPTDFSDAAQDGASGTVVTLDALPPNPKGYIYLGAPGEFRGVQVGTPGHANAVASTLTAEYWDKTTGWTAITITDGTANGGASFAVTGNITFTIPASQAWVPARLLDTATLQADGLLANKAPFRGSHDFASVQGILEAPLYWLRLKTSAAFSAAVDVASIMALARSTAYEELLFAATQELEADSINTTPTGIGALEVLTDQGTGNVVVNLRGEFIT